MTDKRRAYCWIDRKEFILETFRGAHVRRQVAELNCVDRRRKEDVGDRIWRR